MAHAIPAERTMAIDGPLNHQVLLVEDDPDIRSAMKIVLQTDGYEVRTARNGEDGIEQLRAGLRPCLIVLDLIMPIKDGFEFRREQLADAELAKIPVVVYSGHPDVGENAKRLSAAGYFQKPIDLDTLVELVETHCA